MLAQAKLTFVVVACWEKFPYEGFSFAMSLVCAVAKRVYCKMCETQPRQSWSPIAENVKGSCKWEGEHVAMWNFPLFQVYDLWIFETTRRQ